MTKMHDNNKHERCEWECADTERKIWHTTILYMSTYIIRVHLGTKDNWEIF